MKILKFGGSSVFDSKRIKNVVKIVIDQKKTSKVAVVVSAFGGSTDNLLKMANLAVKKDQAGFVLFEEFKARHLLILKELLSENKKVYEDSLVHIEKILNQLKEILEDNTLR